MRKTMANVMFLVFAVATTACDAPSDADQLGSESDLGEAQASGDGLRPFHAAVFDGVPSEEELDLELESFLAAVDPSRAGGLQNLINPTGEQAADVGQKIVRLTVKTGNFNDAGTDNAQNVRFTGEWRVGGTHYTEAFVLDNPGIDDLKKNKTSVYFYALNLDQYVAGATQDIFIRGKVGSTNKDAWFCEKVTVTEINSAGGERNQSLGFNQWIKQFESGWLAGNNAQVLNY